MGKTDVTVPQDSTALITDIGTTEGEGQFVVENSPDSSEPVPIVLNEYHPHHPLCVPLP